MLPHQPLTEQQFPKVDPRQVFPLVPPQEASVETARDVEVGRVVAPPVEKAAVVVLDAVLAQAAGLDAVMLKL